MGSLMTMTPNAGYLYGLVIGIYLPVHIIPWVIVGPSILFILLSWLGFGSQMIFIARKKIFATFAQFHIIPCNFYLQLQVNVSIFFCYRFFSCRFFAFSRIANLCAKFCCTDCDLKSYFWYMVESPVWLARQGKMKECRQVIQERS